MPPRLFLCYPASPLPPTWSKCAGSQTGVGSGLGGCSVRIFEVHDNITRDQIRELEGLFLHIYRKDRNANRLNRQLYHKNFVKITTRDLQKWRRS